MLRILISKDSHISVNDSILINNIDVIRNFYCKCSIRMG